MSTTSLDSQDGRLAALWTPAAGAEPSPVAVLGHGAGAGMTHPFMEGAAVGLAAGGVSCLRFNFPYVEAGRRAPDREPVLLQSWRQALDEGAGRTTAGLVAGGKSLGGRMASVLAAREPDSFAAAALVFFGYPLHAPGRPDRRREEHLFSIERPMLFIQGTADALARFDLVQDLVKRLGERARLHVVEGGDHSFRVRGAHRDAAEIGEELGRVAAAFASEVLAATHPRTGSDLA